jgi:hypothetical protein
MPAKTGIKEAKTVISRFFSGPGTAFLGFFWFIAPFIYFAPLAP